MALKFRLRGLAETFIDSIRCSGCGQQSSDDEDFHTDLSRVTLNGIIVVCQCKKCNEIFVPDTQRLGVVNPGKLKEAVELDCEENGEPILNGIEEVRLDAERLNHLRKSEGLN